MTTKAKRSFGNGLCLVENPDGVILDYELYQPQAPLDREQLIESLQRQSRLQLDQKILAVVGDSGFDGRKSINELKRYGIKNFTCPRNIDKLREQMKDPLFALLQRRRAGTEARIATIKNHARSRPCRAKGYHNRSLWLHWAVIVHNLTWIAKKVMDQQKQVDALAAA